MLAADVFPLEPFRDRTYSKTMITGGDLRYILGRRGSKVRRKPALKDIRAVFLISPHKTKRKSNPKEKASDCGFHHY